MRVVAPSTSVNPEATSFHTNATKTKTYAVIALFSALAVATSLLLALIPNVETISLVIFLVSLRYGFRAGMFTAITVTGIYELIVSQLFGTGVILLPFKLIAYLLIVLMGHLWRESPKGPGKAALTITGASLAITFDLITTLGLVLWLEQPLSTYLVLVTVGIVIPPFFTPLHMLGNAILFQFVPSIQSHLDTIEWPQGSTQRQRVGESCENKE